MKISLVIDETGEERKYYFKNFNYSRFDVDNINIISYNFGYHVLEALKNQEFDLENIKLFVLYKDKDKTPMWLNVGKEDVLNIINENLRTSDDFYIKEKHTYNYKKRDNMTSIKNVFFIHPNVINLIASKEIKNYLKSEQLSDIGIELLKKRLCQLLLLDLNNTLEPKWNYDEF